MKNKHPFPPLVQRPPRKIKKQRRARLNFETQSFLTDLSHSDFQRVLPFLHECFPRSVSRKTLARIHGYLNAISYLSVIYTPWWRVANYRAIYRFYSKLKRLGYLTLIQVMVHSPTPWGIHRPRKIDRVRRATRKRKCSVCPACHADAMVCQGTRKQGSATVRHYRCSECGHTSLWISTPQNEWWKNPRDVWKKHPTCV